MSSTTYYLKGNTYVDGDGNPALIKKGNQLVVTDNFAGGGGSEPYVPPAYSTEEIDTGEVWIDGKHIFRCTYSFENKIWIETNGTNIVAAPSNIEQLLGSSGAIHRDTTSNQNTPIITRIGNGYLVGQGFIRTELKMITIWYTKTTPTRTTKKTTKKG